MAGLAVFYAKAAARVDVIEEEHAKHRQSKVQQVIRAKGASFAENDAGSSPFGDEGLRYSSRVFAKDSQREPAWELVRAFLDVQLDAAMSVEAVVFIWKWFRRRWQIERHLSVRSHEESSMLMRDLFRSVTMVLRVERSTHLDDLLANYEVTDDGIVRGPTDAECFDDPLPWPARWRLEGTSQVFLLVFHDARHVVLLEQPATCEQ